ncbi:actin cytoskeleton-regulatory complex protein PAN1-like, partial [Callorhinchus milii]|uniref:actin cytoskeleton-regulatory complex protein PAN1-like n=1 Tax=Callorhinchus milii TaxID=7868 RepID=UPI001C3FDF16
MDPRAQRVARYKAQRRREVAEKLAHLQEPVLVSCPAPRRETEGQPLGRDCSGVESAQDKQRPALPNPLDSESNGKSNRKTPPPPGKWESGDEGWTIGRKSQPGHGDGEGKPCSAALEGWCCPQGSDLSERETPCPPCRASSGRRTVTLRLDLARAPEAGGDWSPGVSGTDTEPLGSRPPALIPSSSETLPGGPAAASCRDMLPNADTAAPQSVLIQEDEKMDARAKLSVAAKMSLFKELEKTTPVEPVLLSRPRSRNAAVERRLRRLQDRSRTQPVTTEEMVVVNRYVSACVSALPRAPSPRGRGPGPGEGEGEQNAEHRTDESSKLSLRQKMALFDGLCQPRAGRAGQEQGRRHRQGGARYHTQPITTSEVQLLQKLPKQPMPVCADGGTQTQEAVSSPRSAPGSEPQTVPGTEHTEGAAESKRQIKGILKRQTPSQDPGLSPTTPTAPLAPAPAQSSPGPPTPGPPAAKPPAPGPPAPGPPAPSPPAPAPPPNPQLPAPQQPNPQLPAPQLPAPSSRPPSSQTPAPGSPAAKPPAPGPPAPSSPAAKPPAPGPPAPSSPAPGPPAPGPPAAKPPAPGPPAPSSPAPGPPAAKPPAPGPPAPSSPAPG